MWYNMGTIEIGTQGWSATPLKGGEAMTVYETLNLMIAFGLFVIAILSFHKRK